MDYLMRCFDIPHSVREKIRKHSKSKELQQDECIHYWRTISPYSMIGWGFLGGRLHRYGQEATLRAVNEYIQRASGTYGCGMCMYWDVEDAYDHMYTTQQIHACCDVHCVCSSAFVDCTDAHTTQHQCTCQSPHTHSSYMTLIGEHEMHGRVHPQLMSCN